MKSEFSQRSVPDRMHTIHVSGSKGRTKVANPIRDLC